MSFNPFRERALERFQAPQNPVEMASMTSTPISTNIFQVRVGGDVAALKGIMKACIAADDAAIAAYEARVLDTDFIAGHTVGYQALAADLRSTSWGAFEAQSGLARAELEEAARVYLSANSAILVYGMGITQHHRGTENVRQIVNLALLRGNVGRPGAGICPVRGHSNVQGNRTVGITEKPMPEMLARIHRRFGFTPPQAHGHDVAIAFEAMIRNEVKAFISLGCNIAAAAPDTAAVHQAFRNLDLTVSIATKLNRTISCMGVRPTSCRARGGARSTSRRAVHSPSPSRI